MVGEKDKVQPYHFTRMMFMERHRYAQRKLRIDAQPHYQALLRQQLAELGRESLQAFGALLQR